MGAGFARRPRTGLAAGRDGWRATGGARRRAQRGPDRTHQPAVPDIAIDYDGDVLPLTPAGAATERHIISAYVNKAADALPPTPAARAAFWAELLALEHGEAPALLDDRPRWRNVVRANS